MILTFDIRIYVCINIDIIKWRFKWIVWWSFLSAFNQYTWGYHRDIFQTVQKIVEISTFLQKSNFWYLNLLVILKLTSVLWFRAPLNVLSILNDIFILIVWKEQIQSIIFSSSNFSKISIISRRFYSYSIAHRSPTVTLGNIQTLNVNVF